MTLNAPMREWVAEPGPHLPVSDVLGWGWAECGVKNGRAWRDSDICTDSEAITGGIYERRAMFLLYIVSSDTPLCFWLTLALERQFLQLSTIAIHNTATGRCIPPEGTRARMCRIIFWDHQWKLMRMHNKETSSLFPSPLIYFTRLLCACCHHFKHRGYSREEIPALKLFTFIREKIDNQVIKRW